jgi:hypothetical protein
VNVEAGVEITVETRFEYSFHPGRENTNLFYLSDNYSQSEVLLRLVLLGFHHQHLRNEHWIS